MKMWKRSCYCGQIRVEDIGKEVVLMGWVSSIRDHGGVRFVDLRDREGVVQVVFSPQVSKEAHGLAGELGDEYVIAVRGLVQKRPPGTENPRIPTGEIEVLALELMVLNESLPPVFPIEDHIEVNEYTRLKYRYLDLRRPSMVKKIKLRHQALQLVRNYLTALGFLEVETPFLTRSTPEGARDFLVPSRLNPGTFYALPQSPQLFKQILMIAGIDRYFQVVRCFRDEDLRADRQPEFTQVDLEMSFVSEQEVQEVVEGLLWKLFKELLSVEIPTPFPRLPYEEALERFGTDKPDMRFGMELVDLSELFIGCPFRVFSEELERGGVVKSINVKGGGTLSRKELEELTKEALDLGAKGLAWVRLSEDGWHGPISKFLTEGLKGKLQEKTNAQVGDLLLFVSDQREKAREVLGELRLRLAKKLGLVKGDQLRFVWVVDFPLLEYDEDERRFVAVHHPFTSPREEDLQKLDTDPLSVKARAYDIVLNGHEIGGGSIRNHRLKVQEKLFELLGFSQEEAYNRFGFLLEALRYGAPPHGGIALGFDRLMMIISGEETIREVIPFPKTQKGQCPLTGAPAQVEPKQLKELMLKVEI